MRWQGQHHEVASGVDVRWPTGWASTLGLSGCRAQPHARRQVQ